MTLIVSILSALSALPKIGALVESFAQTVTMWYIQGRTKANLKELSDAAALEARAETTEEFYAAAQAWHDALSRPRISP